jgi:tyrosinase
MKLINQTVTILSFCITIAISLSQTPAIAATLVRKNVADLTSQEKADFVNAIKTLKNTIPEGSQVSIYDQFVAAHMGAMAMLSDDATGPSAMRDAAHNTAAFLPWHREYGYRFEEALQSVNPNVTIPYWDWTDPTALDVIFQPDFLGTNGSGVIIDIPGVGSFEGGAVQSGNFSEASGWVLNPDLHIDQTTNKTFGTSLLRFLRVPPADSYPLSQHNIDHILALNDYDIFRPALEGFLTVDHDGHITPGAFHHNYIHGLVGGVFFDTNMIDPITNQPTIRPLGTFSSVPSSPYDPVFWLHHANVDRLWAEWQANGHAGSAFYPSQGEPFGNNLNDPMWPWDGGLSTPGTIGPGDILSYLPDLAPNDIVRPVDTLDIARYGYTYDTLVTSVPEPASTLGLLGLLGLGAASVLKRKRSYKEGAMVSSNALSAIAKTSEKAKATT